MPLCSLELWRIEREKYKETKQQTDREDFLLTLKHARHAARMVMKESFGGKKQLNCEKMNSLKI